ncbi:hypothetical protein Tco_0899427 [Tanacetum coccineum]
METIHVQFDELSEPMAPVQLSTGPAPPFLTPGQISLGLVPNPVPATPYVTPTNKELEILFQPMFDEYLEPPRAKRPVSPASAFPVPVNSAGTPLSTTIDQDAPSPTESTIMEDYPLAPVDNDPFVNVFAPEPCSEASSSGDVIPQPDRVMIIALKWIYKVKLDEYGDVLKNKARPSDTCLLSEEGSVWFKAGSSGVANLAKKVKKSPEDIRDMVKVTVRLKLLSFRFKMTNSMELLLSRWKMPTSFRIYGDEYLYLLVPTGRYVVPTSRVIATDSVIVATSGYVVPAAYDISPGRVK